MELSKLKIWKPDVECGYETKYVSVYVPSRDVYLTYKCRADVLYGDMVHITIREYVPNTEQWVPCPHIGEVVAVLTDEEVERIRDWYWFSSIKLAVVCGREREEF